MYKQDTHRKSEGKGKIHLWYIPKKVDYCKHFISDGSCILAFKAVNPLKSQLHRSSVQIYYSKIYTQKKCSIKNYTLYLKRNKIYEYNSYKTGQELIDSQKNRFLINHTGVNCFLHLQPFYFIKFHNLHCKRE